MYYQSPTDCMETNKSITLICFDKRRYNFWVFNNYISQSHWSWHVALCYLEKRKQVFTSPGWLLTQPECEGIFTFLSPSSSMGKANKESLGQRHQCPVSRFNSLSLVGAILCANNHLLIQYSKTFGDIIAHKNVLYPPAGLMQVDQVSSPNPFQCKVKQGHWKHLSRGFGCSAFLCAEMV